MDKIEARSTDTTEARSQEYTWIYAGGERETGKGQGQANRRCRCDVGHLSILCQYAMVEITSSKHAASAGNVISVSTSLPYLLQITTTSL